MLVMRALCPDKCRKPFPFFYFYSTSGTLRCCLSPIPLDTLVQTHATATEAVQSAAYGQIDGAAAQLGDVTQVLEVPATAGVGHRDAAPLGQFGDEMLIDPTLQTLIVGRMDEEL